MLLGRTVKFTELHLLQTVWSYLCKQGVSFAVGILGLLQNSVQLDLEVPVQVPRFLGHDREAKMYWCKNTNHRKTKRCIVMCCDECRNTVLLSGHTKVEPDKRKMIKSMKQTGSKSVLLL